MEIIKTIISYYENLIKTKITIPLDGGDVNVDDFQKSIYFNELYKSRIKYFSSALIMDLISARQIVKFDSNKIKTFRTKLYKLDYMFWKLIIF